MAPRCGSSVPARLVLGVMAFLMFLVTQMVRLNLNFAIVAMTDTNSTEDQPPWPEHASGVLLGAFYWSYWLTELPGGLLAQRFGGRSTLAAGGGAGGRAQHGAALRLPPALLGRRRSARSPRPRSGSDVAGDALSRCTLDSEN
ncbi:hypothetical protein R5R35_004343 [Gryllus longicercus]|uniref:Uncharacterized protein n=1 Tax=Gryllus longicercus TaxID=2509291 RepID=A0AAN9VSL7_9ORTH